VLAVCGSLRAQSTNAAVLRTAGAVSSPGVTVAVYEGVAALPAFNPDDDIHPLPPPVDALRREIHRADALLFSTPEYAGALPGAFKNALDWMIGDDQPGSIYEKRVGWVNPSLRGASAAYESLRAVLGYAHARIVEAACADIPVGAAQVDADGLVTDAGVRHEIRRLVARLVAA
jgi:NAD(P)H-dependent FMN reductase